MHPRLYIPIAAGCLLAIALASAQTALIGTLREDQPVVTNETDQVALAALADWTATGSVTRLTGPDTWLETANGTTTQYTVSIVAVVTPDTQSVVVVVAEIGAANYEEIVPQPGDIWPWVADRYSGAGGWNLRGGPPWRVYDELGQGSDTTQETPVAGAFDHIDYSISFEWGGAITNQVTITNTAPLITQPTFIILADQVESNTAAIAAIPLPPTNIINGWLVWDSGSNRFWTVTATNLRFYVWP